MNYDEMIPKVDMPFFNKKKEYHIYNGRILEVIHDQFRLNKTWYYLVAVLK